MSKGESFAEGVGFSIFAGERKCVFRNVRRKHFRTGDFFRAGDRNRPCSRAHFHDVRSIDPLEAFLRHVDKHFCFGARDQRPLVALDDKSAETRVADNMLQRFAACAACHHLAKHVELCVGQRLFEVQVNVHAGLHLKPVADDVFGIQTRVRNALLFEEDLGAVQNFKYSHLRHGLP